MNREYYTKDKTLYAKRKVLILKLEKDVDSCLRCGFSYEEVVKTLQNTKNRYSELLED